MSTTSGTILLSLPRLRAEAELSRPVAEALALAASVVLERLHGPGERDAALVHEDDASRAAEIERVPVDERDHATYGDMQEATEEGAEGIAISVAQRVLGRVVFRRLPKRTGADYLMRDPRSTEADGYERLECSGIAEGQETATSRLRSKLDQLARFPTYGSGRAVVTHFRMQPIEIRHGSFRQ
jgi:hypothetical protein